MRAYYPWSLQAQCWESGQWRQGFFSGFVRINGRGRLLDYSALPQVKPMTSANMPRPVPKIFCHSKRVP